MLHRDNGQNLSMKERLVVSQDGPRFHGWPVIVKGLTDASDSASDAKSVVESLVWNIWWWGRRLCFPFSPWAFFLPFFHFSFLIFWAEPEDVLSLLFLDFFFCLSTFLFGEGFVYFASPTTFLGGSSGESPALPLSFRPVSLSEFTTGRIKFGWCWFSCSKSLC